MGSQPMPREHDVGVTRVVEVALLTLCAVVLDNITIATSSRTPYVVVLIIAGVCAAVVVVVAVLCARRPGFSLLAVALMLLCGLACSFVLLDAAGRFLRCLGTA